MLGFRLHHVSHRYQFSHNLMANQHRSDGAATAPQRADGRALDSPTPTPKIRRPRSMQYGRAKFL
jgi:hypothetical protein